MFKSYLIKCFIILLVFCALLGANFLFLKNSGETLSYQEIAQRQSSDQNCLYGSALYDPVFAYKLAQYKIQEPDIVAFGSSRSLQFRKEFFSKSFYNMGYTFSDLNQGYALAKEMLKIHKPKLVIMSIDFWWFNQNYPTPNFDLSTYQIKPHKIADFVKPITWLIDKKIKFNEYKNIILGKNQTCNLGIKAILQNDGYSSDGSYNYTSILAESSNAIIDKNFSDTLSKLENGTNQFILGDLDFDKVEKFKSILKLFKDNDVELVLFFPPNASTVNNKLSSDKYEYISKLKQALKENLIKFTLEQDIPDCEFVDGIHAGDLAYARITLGLPISDKYLNKSFLEETTKTMSHIASIPKLRYGNFKEKDFLKLGCDKKF